MFNSDAIRKAIWFQHANFPMPLTMFDLLYRFKLGRIIFYFYGLHVFQYSYSKRNGNNLLYWLSKESLYWHIWTQGDLDKETLSKILSIDDIEKYIKSSSPRCIEVGFGIGKNYNKILKYYNFGEYIGIEVNKEACDYAGKKFNRIKNFRIINRSVKDLVNDDIGFDVLFCSGGVFMYLDKSEVDSFFISLPKRGVKIVIILNEGTAKDDIFRSSNTVMFNFKKRLETLPEYKNKIFLEEQKENDILKYFVMY